MAASYLLEMRKKGLIYSHQKTAGEVYCRWAITDLGSRVFDGRPDEVADPEQAPSTAPQSPLAVAYLVVNADGKPAADWAPFTDGDRLVRAVQAFLTSNPGHPELTIIRQAVRRIAVVSAPPKPQAQITLL